MDFTSLGYRIGAIVFSAIIGMLLTLLVQTLTSRRGLFGYSVVHNNVGVSTDDAAFGRVRVTWNDTPIRHLYLSVAELKNESLRDFDNVVVKIVASGTRLLGERSELIGTTRSPDWTDEYKQRLAVERETGPTEEQENLYYGEREYLLQTINRGQVVRFAYLNDATTNSQPTLAIDIVHKGVRVKLRTPDRTIMGVSQVHATSVGVVVGLLVLGAVILYVDTIWIGSIICMLYGFMVVVPGALCIRSWRWFREHLGG